MTSPNLPTHALRVTVVHCVQCYTYNISACARLIFLILYDYEYFTHIITFFSSAL